jgi:hypothetical protein
MTNPFPERDWKVFRELREVALERLCERALGDASVVIGKPDKTHHERFLELFALVADRNREVARGFDAPRRSAMLLQLTFINGLGLLEADELARFSDRIRETLESLAKLR